jgi:phospholipid/cholesterol/gamma-HCH transport system substrate-binding protein
MSQRSIEVKVGALILVALGLLGAFVVVMGGLSFEPTYTVYVSFHNPGGLQTGAPVRISGVKVGRVSAIEFRGGMIDPKTRRPEPLIRATAKLEKKYQEAIREDSRWFVTSQGVLGEMFLAVDPGSGERPPLADGATVQGISPPRLDLLLSESYELLHRAYLGVANNETKIAETFDGLHRTLQATGGLLEENEPKISRALDNLQSLSGEARETLEAARQRYIDGPQVNRILNNLDHVTGSVNQQIDPLLADSREVLANGKKLTHSLASDEQLERYRAITRDLSDAASTAKSVARDTNTLVAGVKQGKGTIGALVTDDAIYDDLQELLRDLKHNPWKFFWKQ